MPSSKRRGPVPDSAGRLPNCHQRLPVARNSLSLEVVSTAQVGGVLVKRVIFVVMLLVVSVPSLFAGGWTRSLANATRQAKAGDKLIFVDLRSEEHTSELQSLRHLVC